MRYDFDAFLLNLAQRAGAEARLGSPISELDLAGKRLRLVSGQVLSYRFLVGADGVNSQVARSLFGQSFNQETIGFGLEIEVPREHLPKRPDAVEIEFDAARWGYGWVFPKRQCFTFGVGGIHSLNPNLRDRLTHFLSVRGVDVKKFKVKGQYIPFGDYRSCPGRDSVFLCGDAAGLVDPITGEGISFALESGAAAGKSIAQEIVTGGTAKADILYHRSYKGLVRSIRQANFWRNLIFPKIIQRSFAYTFADASTLQRAYLDILAGKKQYDSLYHVFLIQAGKALRKITFKLLHKLTRSTSAR